MVKHFQQLFDIPRVEGVYAGMSRVYQQLGEARNILARLKEMLELGRHSVSNLNVGLA